MQQWKKYENPSIFARVIEEIKVSRFFMDHSVDVVLCVLNFI